MKYAFGQTIWSGGEAGILGLVPNEEDGVGYPVEGVNLSMLLLQIHGMLYVIYLFADFRVWRLANLTFKDFLIIASGGIIPLTSFFIERLYQKRLVSQIKAGA